MHLTSNLSTPLRTLTDKRNLVATTLILVASADILLFGHALGLNAAIFLTAILTASLVASNRPIHITTLVVGAIFAAAVILLLEQPTFASIGLAIFALAGFCMERFGGSPKHWTDWPSIFFRLATFGPFRMIRDGLISMRLLRRNSNGTHVLARFAVWIVPVGLGSIFAVLFRSANPIIDVQLSLINFAAITEFLNGSRLLFWFLTALFVWAMLRPRLKWKRSDKEKAQPRGDKALRDIIFGPSAILKALILFNLLFGVQTVLDLAYLWAGASLPKGISYADYAHRGAYPLVFTAILAATFVLGIMRRNGVGERNNAIKYLVYVWIAQNILMCASAILRLELYIEIFSLTQFRLAAIVWMGLVAVGLILIIVRILMKKSNAWLISTNLISLALVLVLGSVVDTSALVARYNIAHCAESGGPGQKLDTQYLLTLGYTIIPVLDIFLETQSLESPRQLGLLEGQRNELASSFLSRNQNWRSWTFRAARLDAYLLQGSH